MADAKSQTSNIGCVVLAAGTSRRFGGDKRNYKLPNGLSLLEQTLANLYPQFRERVLILRPGDGVLAMQFQSQWKIVIAIEASEGMGRSLAAAVPSMQNWDGAVIALADMPWIAPGTIQHIIETLTPASLVVPHHQGQRGNPVGIGANYFPELSQLQGDTGARTLFQRHADKVIKLDVPDPGVLQDMDTPPAS